MFKSVLGYAGRALRPRTTLTSKDPVHLALQPQQILHDQYRILSRLGQGQESTVWLAEEVEKPKNPVALRILTDYVTSLQEEHAFELRVMERIARLPSTHPQFTNTGKTSNLPSLLGHFYVPGERGNHLCMVTEALGPSVLDIQQTEQGRAALPEDVVQHIARQVLRALEALHEGCRAVHTDIKPDNILFRRSTLGADGKFDGGRVFDPDNLVLTDYGTAMPLEVDSDRLIQPEALRCPEVLLGCKWGVKADIWNLGCIIFELLTVRRLFNPRPLGKYSAEQYHLGRIYGMLVDDADRPRLHGFFKGGTHYETFFKNGALLLDIAPEAREPLRKILEIYNIYSSDLLEFLTAMLQVHPDDRLSARELQSLAWVRE